jgi:hypothetical protein
MNKQEIFDKVLTHLRKQGKAAVNDNGDCMYRAADGRQCAAGCLITDEEYEPQMEGRMVGYLLNKGQLPARLVPHVEFLRDLQDVHDNALHHRGIRAWEESMDNLARIHALQYTPPQA